MRDSQSRRPGILFVLLSLVAAAPSCGQQSAPPRPAVPIQSAPSRPAVPIEPITAILDAFRSHSIVALSEGTTHGDEQSYAFRLALIRDPRFAATVNDIVVESGNALYQDVIDRFVRGDEVPYGSLRQVWQNTTQPHSVWDAPIYEEFYRAVRAVNASLPKERQLRVLLGDPPMHWERIHTSEDIRQWMANPLSDRDRYPADLIRREVLAKQRRALVVYGAMHLQRRNLLSNYEPGESAAPTIVSLLEAAGGTKVFTIWVNAHLEALQADVASWGKPSLAMIRGTVLGAADFTFYYPYSVPRMVVIDGKPVPVARDRWRSLRMEDQADAVLYPGAASGITVSRLSPALCVDSAYMEMRLRRLSLWEQSSGLTGEAERLKQVLSSCGTEVGQSSNVSSVA